MSEKELEEILLFRSLVSEINKELASKKIYNLEYLLINNSISDVFHVLEEESTYYDLIKDEKYGSGYSFSDFLECYFEYVKTKYDSLLIKDGKNDRIADKYYDKLKEPVGSSGQYIQYSKDNIGMIQSDVEKTLLLMREAIVAYYSVYHNKILEAELTTDNLDESDYLEFQMKEQELLHLLGVTSGQLKNNPDFIRLTGTKDMSSIDIIEWILKDIDGNNDLLQYNEDFLKRISNSSFSLVKTQFDGNTQSRLLNYHKIRAKSQAFIKYGPLEKVSLVSKLKEGKHITTNSKSNTAMITRAETFKKYPWAYFGSVQEPDKKYIETLAIDSSENKKELFKGSKPAIIKRVYTLDGGGTGSVKVFSDEEQFDLFCQAYDDFKTVMDFKNLTKYFAELSQSKKFDRGINNLKK